ncbi:MAG: hypothetical protein FWC50_15180 [Planctomycetaceae bacterium]|nr:hypothetical protein [Planctomycetaceae bacterium]
MTSLMDFLKTLALVVVPLGMMAVSVPQGTAQPPQTKEQKEWGIPNRRQSGAGQTTAGQGVSKCNATGTESRYHAGGVVSETVFSQ